jgi:uncharacterized membrane protein
MTNIKETSRLESFSDGVFGFAATLLVIDIHVPTVAAGQSLFDLLAADWPTYISFLIGFFTILVCWINHHLMFDYIYKSNSKLLLLNGFKLLMVTLTPFATAVLAKYVNTDQQATAASVYAFNFALMGLSMFLIWLYAYRTDLMKEESHATLRTITRYYFLAVIMSATILVLSFINIWLCLGMACVMFATFLFPELMIAYATRVRIKSNTIAPR